MRIKYKLLFIISIVFHGCIDPYSPTLSDYLNTLVVDATITNEPGPYIVKLSKSSTVYDPEFNPVSGARIVISDDLGNDETLTEIEPGVYSTIFSGIQGIVGRRYSILIETEGKIYQSPFEELREPVTIDSVYPKVEYRGGLEGLQFYVDTKDVKENSKNFLWTLNETYKYEADDYPLEMVFVNKDSIYEPSYEYQELIKTCWKTDKIFQIFTNSAKNISEPQILNFPLIYVDTESKKLYLKYSLLVNQYSISEDAYRYWNEIKEQNAESGSFYTKQPFQVIGNIVNVNDPDEVIFGYFTVAGLSSKRIFVDKPDLNFYFDVCKATHEAYVRWTNSAHPSYPVYLKFASGGLGKAGIGCFDCRMKGGKTNRPDFWID